MSELNIGYSDLSKRCRLCLAADPTISIDVFSFCNEINSKICEAVMKCAPVQIDIEDKLPKVICNSCHQKLIVTSEFQKKILSSEQALVSCLNKLENRDYHNINILKSPLDIKMEPLDVTVKCENDGGDPSEQLIYNDVDDSKINFYNPTNVEDVKDSIVTNSSAIYAEEDCQLSKNSVFCSTDIVEQDDTDTRASIIKYSEESCVDISETKVCLPNLLDEDSKRPDLTHFMQNASVADTVNEFCLSDVKMNENVETTDRSNSPRSSFSKKCNVKSNAGAKRHQCDVCDKSFTYSSNLITHKRIHMADRLYKCDLCDKSFSTSSHFIIHKRIHTGERPFKCDLCDKSFSQRGSLIYHKRTHTGERPHKCDLCDKSFYQRVHLIYHKRTHTGERPFKCDMCDKSYLTSSHLISHKRTHTGERPYKCDFCDTSFCTSGNLIVHKCIHTGESPYKCNLCDKNFPSSSHLIIHKRTHSGERPYKCDLCDKSFARPDILIRHKLTHIKKT